MKLSKLFRLNELDFLKGLITAIFGAILTALYDAFQSNEFDWKKIGTTAILAGLSYLMVRFNSNSKGYLFKKDIGGTNPPPSKDEK